MTVESILESMSLEQKVGQLFHVGFPGTEVTDELTELIATRHVGGIIYFRENIASPEDAASLSAHLQRLAADHVAPVLISVDEEGGAVSRIRNGVRFPSQMAVGATGDVDHARASGEAIAEQLSSAGITMNLAPVLDINNNPNNPVIGTRSYGEEPDRVAEFGAAAVDGIQSAGVVACGKHFPGHGDTATDSHLDLPVIEHDVDRLREVELVPFRQVINCGVDAVMTAHVNFPAVESDPDRPATLSRPVITGLLRKELGYDGLVMTDSMEMDAIADGIGTVDGCVQAVDAGADVVLVPHSPEKQHESIDAMLEAVESGRIDEARVDKAVARQLRVKRRRLGGGGGLSAADGDATVHWSFNRESAEALARDIARDAVTLVRDSRDELPFEPGAAATADPIAVIGFEIGRVSQVESETKGELTNPFVDQLRDHGYDAAYHRLSDGDPVPDAEGPTIVMSYNATQEAYQREVIDTLEPSPIVCAIRNPYDVRACDIDAFLTCYDHAPASLEAAADVVVGELLPRGTAPVTLEVTE